MPGRATHPRTGRLRRKSRGECIAECFREIRGLSSAVPMSATESVAKSLGRGTYRERCLELGDPGLGVSVGAGNEHVREVEVLGHGPLLTVLFEPRSELGVGRLRDDERLVEHEAHLARDSLMNDRVISLEPARDRLSVQDLLVDPPLRLFGDLGRSWCSTEPSQRVRRDLAADSLVEHDRSLQRAQAGSRGLDRRRGGDWRRLLGLLGSQRIECEQHRADHDEVHERLTHDRLQPRHARMVAQRRDADMLGAAVVFRV